MECIPALIASTKILIKDLRGITAVSETRAIQNHISKAKALIDTVEKLLTSEDICSRCGLGVVSEENGSCSLCVRWPDREVVLVRRNAHTLIKSVVGKKMRMTISNSSNSNKNGKETK
jgi:hypothetical protein